MGFEVEWAASVLVFFITSTISEFPVPVRGVKKFLTT
jgi:hypothetical protein